MADIIIITCNSKNKIERCLESIRKNTSPDKYTLTIVDNGSTDSTQEYLKSQKDINLISNQTNLGYVKAFNLGLHHTKHKLIAKLDDDVEVSKGWLEKLECQMKEKVGVVGCKIVSPDGQILCAEVLSHPFGQVGLEEVDLEQRDYIRECDMVTGTGWLMKRELIEKIGYFDERYFPSQYDDPDYCLQARLSGYKIIYNGKVSIIHYTPYQLGSGSGNLKNYKLFLKKWDNFSAFPREDSHPADIYNAAGFYFFRKRKHKKAIEEFRKVDPKFVLHKYLAESLYLTAQYKEAIEIYEKFMEFNPHNIESKIKLANCFLKVGNYHKPIEILEGIEKNVFAYDTLGQSFMKTKRYSAAIKMFKETFKLDKRYLRSILDMIKCYLLLPFERTVQR